MKSNIERIRLIYLKSRYNRIFLNDIAREKESRDYSEYVGLLKRYGIFKKHHSIFYLYALAIVVIAPLLNLCKFVQSLLCLITSPKKELKGKKFFLATSIALHRVSNNANLYDTNSLWLELPWCKTQEISNSQRINFYNVITFKELFSAIKEAILIFYYMLYRDGLKYAFLNIRVFDWYLYYYSVTKIPLGSDVYFCSHKDYWCSLLGSLKQYNQILIQHGTEFLLFNNNHYSYLKYDTQNKFWYGDYPVKYSNLKKVFVFSEKDYVALCKAILQDTPPFIKVGYGVTLTDLGSSEKRRILIIGFYRGYPEEEEIIIKAFQKKDVVLYLKNHPTVSPARYDRLKEKYNFIFINEPVYPVVDMVFSYESTLALAYEDIGIKVYYYNEIDFQSFDANNY